MIDIATEENFKKAVMGWPTATRFSPAIPVIGNTVRNMRVTYPSIPDSGNPVNSFCIIPIIPVAGTAAPVAAVPPMLGTAPNKAAIPTYLSVYKLVLDLEK